MVPIWFGFRKRTIAFKQASWETNSASENGTLFRQILGGSIRGLMIFSAVGFAAAIVMGKMCGPSLQARCSERVRIVNFPLSSAPFSETEPRFVDIDTGVESRLDVPDGEVLDLIGASPWHDEDGNAQVAGRWSSRSGKESGLIPHDFGIARFTFPGGEPLNRVPTDITPTGRVCWLPGTKAKIVFAAGDGALYRFSFESSTERHADSDGCDTRPYPLSWKVAPPGEGEGRFHITDPYQPEDCGFNGRLLVSLSLQNRGKEVPQLWWIQLDRDATSIQALGPLTDEPNQGQNAARERNPTVVRTPSGEVLIAYLERNSELDPWRLVVAKVEFDLTRDRRPHVDRSSAKVVVDDCAFSTLAFSKDAKWLYYVPNDRMSRLVRRLPVPRLRQEGRDSGPLVAMARPDR